MEKNIGSKEDILSLIKKVNKEITADKTINAFDLERQKCNLEILGKLESFLKEHPDFRFIQALWALNIVDKEDRFYEEPGKTLDKVNNAIAGFKKK